MTASQHSHTWGPIQHDAPPAYMLAAHGRGAFAGHDDRYRACTGRGCDERVYGADVDHQSVRDQLANDHFPARMTSVAAIA